MPAASPKTASDEVAERVRNVVDRHYDFVWRTLQHLGLTEANAEDGAQQVMCVLARRIEEISPGAETAFLLSTAMRVASEARRSARRRPPASDVTELDDLISEAPTSEELVDQRRAREVLAKIIDAMPEELRMVFVLFEIEELTTPAIAEMLDIPPGTAASRLRRAREMFRATVARMQAGGER